MISHPNMSLENTQLTAVRAEFWYPPQTRVSWKVQFWLRRFEDGLGFLVPPLFVCRHEGEALWYRKGGLQLYVHDGTHRLSAMRIWSEMIGYNMSTWAHVLAEPPPLCDMSKWKFTGQHVRVY